MKKVTIDPMATTINRGLGISDKRMEEIRDHMAEVFNGRGLKSPVDMIGITLNEGKLRNSAEVAFVIYMNTRMLVAEEAKRDMLLELFKKSGHNHEHNHEHEHRPSVSKLVN